MRKADIMRRIKNIANELQFNPEKKPKYLEEKLKSIKKKSKALREVVHKYPVAEGKHECCDVELNSSSNSKQDWRAKAAELHNNAKRLRKQTTAPLEQLSELRSQFTKIQLEAAIVRAQAAYAEIMGNHHANGTQSLENKAVTECARVLDKADYHGSKADILEMQNSVKSTKEWAKEAIRYSKEAEARKGLLKSLQEDINKTSTEIDGILVQAVELDAHAAYASVKSKPMYEATIIDPRAIDKLLSILKNGFKPPKPKVDTNVVAQLEESFQKEEKLIREKNTQKRKIDALELELSELKAAKKSKSNEIVTEEVVILKRKLEDAESDAKENKESAKKTIANLGATIVDLKESISEARNLAEEKTILQKKLEEMESKAKEEKTMAKKTISALEEKLVDLNQSMSNVGKLAEEKTVLERKLEEVESNGEEEKKTAKKRIATLEEQIVELKETISSAETMTEVKSVLEKKLAETESNAKEERNSANQKIAALEEELAEEKNILKKKLEDTVSKAEEEKSSMKKKITALEECISNLKKDAENPSEIKKQMIEMKEEVVQAQAMLHDNDLLVVEIEERNDELKERLKTLKQKETMLMSKIESMSEEMEKMKKMHKEAMEKILSEGGNRENKTIGSNENDFSDYSI